MEQMDDPDKNFLVDKILDKRYNKKARMVSKFLQVTLQ